MKRHIQTLFIFLLVLVSFNFFETRSLPDGFTRQLQFFFAFAAVAISLPYAFPKWEGFVFPIQLMVLAMVLSIVTSYLSWSQGFIDSIKATIPLMLWIFVFFLLRINISIKTIEKIILIYGGIYIILYLFQFIYSDTVYFGWSSSFSTDRGIIRIIFPGGGIFFLASFIALNKITTKNSKKYIWAPFVVLGILIPILQVTRLLIAATIFIYLIHLIRGLDIIKKTLILFTFLAVVIFISNSNISVIKGLKNAQQETSKQGEEYIRIVASKYFLSEFSPNILSRVMGNGAPYGDKSFYGKQVTKLQETKDYYLSDVGIVAIYIMFGLLSIVAYILIWVKSFTIPLPKEYMYLKYYLWFLLVTSFTSYSIYHYNYLIATVFVLYIYQKIYYREKNRGSKIEFVKKLLSDKEHLQNSLS